MGTSLRLALFAFLVVLAGCKGDTGPQGPQGPEGLQGPQGAPGVAYATAPLGLDGGANATLSIARATAAADGYLAASDFQTFHSRRSTGGGNLLEWRSDVALWANTCGVVPSVTVTSADSQEGDTSFELNVATPDAAGSCEEYGELIEVDPTASYAGQVWAKLVAGAGGFYAGVATYDASKTFIDNRYFIASNTTLAVGTWVQLTGVIGGVGGGQSAFPANARFMRPIVNPNFNDLGITRVDGLKIFEGVRRLPTLYRQGASSAQTFPNTDSSCGISAGSPWTTINGMSINFSVTTPTEIELNFAGSMADEGGRTEGLHCALRYLIDGNVVADSSPNFGHYAWSTNTYLWHGISARRRALVGAGTHTVTVQARSGLCGSVSGDTNYCYIYPPASDPALALALEVLVP